jgi:hypothetical protein
MLNKLAILAMTAVVLTGCGGNGTRASSHTDLDFREAEQAGYVTIGPGGAANVGKLEDFLRDYQGKKSSELTVVHYTDEGDPIYLDLSYDGQAVRYVYDNTWDAFGGRKGVKETTCRTFAKRTGSYGITYGTEYYVSDCADDIGYSRRGSGEYHIYFIEEAKAE